MSLLKFSFCIFYLKDERKVNDQTNVLIVAPSSDNIDEKGMFD